jgi:site-specific recombinase XerD
MDDLIGMHLSYLTMKGRRPNTVAYQRRALARLGTALAPVPLADAAEADLAAWRASLSHLSDAAVIAYVARARCWYGWLVRTGYRPDNPAADLPVPPSPEYRPRPMSEEDLIAVISAASGRVRAWLILAAVCGLRPVEIACLRCACIRDGDLVPGIRIAPEATKGGRHGRFVALTGSEWVFDELRECGLPSSGWAYPRLDGRPGHVAPHLVSHRMCAHIHACGFPDTAYALRHRCGTRLLAAAGGNIRVVQDVLGHLKLSTTAAYTLVENAESAAAIAAMPVPLPRPPARRTP